MTRSKIYKEKLKKSLANFRVEDFNDLYKFSKNFISKSYSSNKNRKKLDYIYLFEKLLDDKEYLDAFLKKLYETECSKNIYYTFIWLKYVVIQQDEIYKLCKDIENYLPYEINYKGSKLYDNLGFINVDKDYHHDNKIFFFISENIRMFLQYILPRPEDYNLLPLLPEKIKPTKYSYENETGILDFINIASDMFESGLIEFNKAGTKPLAKTIKMLKSSIGIKEFYQEKPLNDYVSNLLLITFFGFYHKKKKLHKKPIENLKEFITTLDYWVYTEIYKILLTHLKGIVSYYYSGIYKFAQKIFKDFPSNNFVSIENILHYAIYRDIKLDINSRYDTNRYKMDVVLQNEMFYFEDYVLVEENYNELFYFPYIKGIMFYFAALGIVEIRYDEPISKSSYKQRGKDFVLPWDGLRYVRLTELGRYIFGHIDKYKPKEIKKAKQEIKFDEYKPIITINPNDMVLKTKVEKYAEPIDKKRYILSYAQIFKDCKTKKQLKNKIDNFYEIIEKNPPQIFKDFLSKIEQNTNLFKKKTDEIVIELKNNKELLNLFLTNHKLKEMIIKAEGYRVIVLKSDLPKFTKIVKENGFFVEF